MTVLEKPKSARASGLVANSGGRGGTAALAVEQIVPVHLLDGGEVVYFALKPSPWFVLLVSLKWVIAGAVIVALSMWDVIPLPFSSRWYLYHMGFWMAVGRLGWGLLEWVSRLYVLTNRRAMRIRGVFNVEVFTCSLDRIQNTYLHLSVPERMTRTGTVTFQTAADGGGTASWRAVSRPLEVHQRLREAICRAQSRGGNGS